MDNQIEIQDQSNDHKYFTQIPNIVLEQSNETELALYVHMKRLAGRSGVCRAGQKYLMSKLGRVGKTTFKKTLQSLLDRGWIVYKGKIKVMTTGGLQWINTYIVPDLWIENMDYFRKGGSGETHLRDSKSASGGSTETPLDGKGGSAQTRGGVSNELAGGSGEYQEEDVFKKIEDGESLQAENQNAENRKRLKEVREELIKKGALSFPKGEVAKQKI